MEQIHQVVNSISQALENNPYLDVSIIFDKVRHEGLLHSKSRFFQFYVNSCNHISTDEPSALTSERQFFNTNLRRCTTRKCPWPNIISTLHKDFSVMKNVAIIFFADDSGVIAHNKGYETAVLIP